MEEIFHYPKVRHVDFFPAEISGQRVICIKDPLNLSGKILFVPYPLFFMISLFDGQHSIVDVQAEFMRQFGELLYREKIESLLIQLEDHFLLESDRFRGAERKLVEEFQKASFRPLTLAGESYEKDPAKLLKAIRNTLLNLDEPESQEEAEGFERLGCRPCVNSGNRPCPDAASLQRYPQRFRKPLGSGGDRSGLFGRAARDLPISLVGR